MNIVFQFEKFCKFYRIDPDDKLIKEVSKVKPDVIFKIHNAKIENNTINVDNFKIKSMNFLKFLKKEKFKGRLVFIAATLGKESDKILKKYKKQPYEYFILDKFFSLFIDKYLDFKQIFFFRKKTRFSPGYGDLSLETQPIFVKLSGAEKIGIKVIQNSFQLIPIKSITAAFPV